MVDIEGAFALTEVVEAALAIPDGIAVFTTEGRELRVLAILGSGARISRVTGEIACLRLDIFVALDVGVEESRHHAAKASA